MLLNKIIKYKIEILDIFKSHGASKVMVIGSVSRRAETEESDIDFVAELKKDDSGVIDLQAHSDLIRDLQIYFGRKVELASYEQIEEQYPTALKDGFQLK